MIQIFFYFLIIRPQQKQAKAHKDMVSNLKKGDKIGELIVKFDNNIIANQPLYALQSAPNGGFFTRMKDSVRLTCNRWFSS